MLIAGKNGYVSELPVIDIAPLMLGTDDRDEVAARIGAACRDSGFFYITGHGVSHDLVDRLDAASRAFFALPEAVKDEIAMERGGRAWRGFFPVGGELTSGRPDLKEGLYFGAELPPSDLPLHGPNLFPGQVPALREAVLAYLESLTRVAQAVLGGIALSLGLPGDYFSSGYTADPTILFRIFHYPPADPGDDGWGWGSTRTTGCSRCCSRTATAACRCTRPAAGWTRRRWRGRSSATSATCWTN